jgi:hypothetical protein
MAPKSANPSKFYLLRFDGVSFCHSTFFFGTFMLSFAVLGVRPFAEKYKACTWNIPMCTLFTSL